MSKKIEPENGRPYEGYNSKDIFHKINEIDYEKLLIFYSPHKYRYVKSLYSYWYKEGSIIFSFLTFSNTFVHIKSESITNMHIFGKHTGYLSDDMFSGMVIMGKTSRPPCSEWRIFIHSTDEKILG